MADPVDCIRRFDRLERIGEESSKATERNDARWESTNLTLNRISAWMDRKDRTNGQQNVNIATLRTELHTTSRTVARNWGIVAGVVASLIQGVILFFIFKGG